jgi:hypothetical protein
VIGKAGFANPFWAGQHPSVMHPFSVEGVQYLCASAIMAE